MTETSENQPTPKKPNNIFYKKIALMVLIFAISSFLVYGIMLQLTHPLPKGDVWTVQQNFTKTITVKALSPTGSDLGLGIFATDETGYLSYPNDANITTGEKNISVGKTYDITYYYEGGTHLRIITHIEQNITSI